MSNSDPLPDWHESDVVCVAIIAEGQIVVWPSGSYEPEESVWPPEGTFVRLQRVATELKLPKFGSLDICKQSRLSPDECRAILEHWNGVEAAVEQTPGAGWAAAIALILKRCAA